MVRFRSRVTLAVAAMTVLWLLAGATAASATTVWAVGDGSDSGTADNDVANMIVAQNPDAFLYLGDVYDSGTALEFSSFYTPGYGQLSDRTYPTPGNHEWGNRGTGYYPYWQSRFGGVDYYSFDLGGWHFLSLNSESDHASGSAQVEWLKQDLVAHPGTCNIAFSHRPRYSAGVVHGDAPDLEPLVSELNGHSAIRLAGHDHSYQRIASADGATSFVVGTGGHGHTGVNASYSGLQNYDATDYGALRLDLSSGRASYEFRTVAGVVIDSGQLTCQQGAATTAPDPVPDSALSLSVSSKSRQRLARALRHGLRTRIECDRACSGTVVVELRSSKSKTAASRTLARKRFELAEAGKKTVRLKFKRSRRSQLSGRHRVRLRTTVKAAAASGDAVSKSIDVLLRSGN